MGDLPFGQLAFIVGSNTILLVVQVAEAWIETGTTRAVP